MKKDILLSIVVPVYNVKNYLKNCIDSIIEQEYQNWELIAVDDGSTDGSGELLDALAETDERIKVLHIENSGVSNARNCGLDIATGEYIGFVDSDDYIDKKMYSYLVETALKENSDIVQCGFQMVNTFNYQSEKTQYKTKQINGREDIISNFCNKNIANSLCNKIFKKTIISDLRVNTDYRTSEDGLFVYECCKKCERVSIFDGEYYFYYQRRNSVTHEPVNEKRMDVFRFLDLLKEENKNDRKLCAIIIQREMKTALDYYNDILINAPYSRADEFKRLIKARMRKNFKDTKVNKEVSLLFKIRILIICIIPGVYECLYGCIHRSDRREQISR